MNEMAIAYQVEDEDGVTYKMQNVYAVYRTDSKTPYLYLFTRDAARLRVSIYHDGCMSHRDYPTKAEPAILQSLHSCNLLKRVNEITALNVGRVARSVVN